MCSLNLIKLNDELRQEIKDFSIFGKKNQQQIHEINNFLIWISIRREIKEQNQGRKIDCEDREFDEVCKN